MQGTHLYHAKICNFKNLFTQVQYFSPYESTTLIVLLFSNRAKIFKGRQLHGGVYDVRVEQVF